MFAKRLLLFLLLLLPGLCAAIPLRQSTAVTVKLGPMQDPATRAPETGLTLHAAHIRLSKNGGAFGGKHDSNDLAHTENGYYNCKLDATDTGTLGLLTLAWPDSNAIPERQDYEIMGPNAYDALYGTGKMDVNAVSVREEIDANSTMLAAIKAMTDLMAVVTTTLSAVDANDANNITLTAGQDANDAYTMSAIMVQDATDGHSEVRWVKTYQTGRIVRVSKPLSFTPEVGDAAWILGPAYGGIVDLLQTMLNAAQAPIYRFPKKDGSSP